MKGLYAGNRLRRLWVLSILHIRLCFHLLGGDKGKRGYCKCLIVLRRIGRVGINGIIVQSF